MAYFSTEAIRRRQRAAPRNKWGIPQNVGSVDKTVRTLAAGGLLGFLAGRYRALSVPVRVLLALTGLTLLVEAALGF
ncbi:MAG: DUF2892 domain-containing protein [Actinobacteria bacterium]|nr:MAG: DUF2892 domain-containing protein [Actinomycetota bacterium]